MANNEPRKHHVLPAFYLAGFTPNDSPTGRLHVFDFSTGKRYKSTPRQAHRQTDYFRLEVPSVDPNLVEKELSRHETALAPSVRQVGSGEIADREAIAKTLELAAALHVRSPTARMNVGKVAAAAVAAKLRKGHISREEWEQIRQSELRNGATPDEAPEYDEAISRLLNTEWYPRPPTGAFVSTIFELIDRIWSMLRRHRWETHVTDPTANGGFITSTSPLAWGDLDAITSGRVPTGSIDDPEIELTFPVSRRVALIGYPRAREARCAATDQSVAHVNARALHLSGGMIFHAHNDFLLRRGSEIREGTEFFRFEADRRRRGIIDPAEALLRR
jgi:hypothetical protein